MNTPGSQPPYDPRDPRYQHASPPQPPVEGPLGAPVPMARPAHPPPAQPSPPPSQGYPPPHGQPTYGNPPAQPGYGHQGYGQPQQAYPAQGYQPYGAPTNAYPPPPAQASYPPPPPPQNYPPPAGPQGYPPPPPHAPQGYPPPPPAPRTQPTPYTSPPSVPVVSPAAVPSYQSEPPPRAAGRPISQRRGAATNRSAARPGTRPVSGRSGAAAARVSGRTAATAHRPVNHGAAPYAVNPDPAYGAAHAPHAPHGSHAGAPSNNATRNAVIIVGIVLGVCVLLGIIAAVSSSRSKPASTYNTSTSAPDTNTDAANTATFGSAPGDTANIGYDKTTNTPIDLTAERTRLDAAADRYFDSECNRSSTLDPGRIYDARRLTWEILRHLAPAIRRDYERNFNINVASMRTSLHTEVREDRLKYAAEDRIEYFDLIRVERIEGRPEAITYWRAFDTTGWMERVVLWMIQGDSGEWLVYDTLWVDSNSHLSKLYSVWFDPALDNPTVAARIHRKFDQMEADLDRLDQDIEAVPLSKLDGYIRDRDLRPWHSTIERYRLDLLWVDAIENPMRVPKLRAEFERLLKNPDIGTYVHRQYGRWLLRNTDEYARSAELMEHYQGKFGPDESLNEALGYAYQHQGEIERARKAWQQWIDAARRPGSCHAAMLESRLIHDEDPAAAAMLFKAMIDGGAQEQATNAVDWVALDWAIDSAAIVALADATSLDALPASALWSYAVGMREAGREDEALDALRSMLHTADADALSAVIGALVELGADADVLDALDRDLNLARNIDPAIHARLLADAGRDEAARAVITRGITANREDQTTVDELLRILLDELKDVAATLEQIKQLKRSSPAVARLMWDVEADALLASDREDEAVALVTGVARDRGMEEGHHYGAMAWLERNGRWAELLDVAETAAEGKMTDWVAAYLGTALVALDRPDEAVPVYRSLLRLYSASFWHRDAAAHALLDLGEPTIAFQALMGARANEETGVGAARLAIWRAYANAALGETAEAVRLVKAAYEAADELDYLDRTAMLEILLEHGEAATALRYIEALSADVRPSVSQIEAKAHARSGSLDRAAALLASVPGNSYTSFDNAVALAGLCMRAGELERAANALASVGAEFGEEAAPPVWWWSHIELAVLNEDTATALAHIADLQEAWPQSVTSGPYFARSSQPGAREIWQHPEVGAVLREWYTDVTKRAFRMPEAPGR